MFRCVCIRVFVLVFVLAGLWSCKDRQLTTDENARLSFSTDTINFDTVFTAMGSSTRCVMVYNPNSNAVRISRVWWQKGEHFFANLDGENNTTRWQNIDIYGGDSLFLFVRVEIDPYGTNTHPIETDTLYFEVNGNRQHIAVEAYGMDVERIRTAKNKTTYLSGAHFTADKPYLIYDTIEVNGPLTIDAGASFYMHNTASITAYGSVEVNGTVAQPVRFMGDRTDYLFPNVPYRVASGQWGGIFLLDTTSCGTQPTYRIENIQLLSGQVGLYCYCKNKEQLSHLIVHNARVHNMSSCGIVVENSNAEISNAEISNCASFGLYLCGGIHRVEQSSIANYFGYPYTTINIHSTTRKDVAAVYVMAKTQDMAISQSSLYNCIITGATKPALVVDSIPESGYQGTIAGCYVRCDSLPYAWAHSNVLAQDQDTVFKNTYYKYGEYIYYDFHLTENSPARKIGLPLDSLKLPVTNDLQDKPRDGVHPDAGCYIYE